MLNSYHQQATGKNAGKWVPCTAKQKCRLGGLHVNSTSAKELNTIIRNLPEGVTLKTESTLEYSFKALPEDAKNYAYNEWLKNKNFTEELKQIEEFLKTNETIDDFTATNVKIYQDYNIEVNFQGRMLLQPSEAQEAVQSLSDEDIENISIFSNINTRKDIYDMLINEGIDVSFPSPVEDSWNVEDYSSNPIYVTISETNIVKQKIGEQAKIFKTRANIDYDYYRSMERFKEEVETNEYYFNDKGEIIW